MIEGTLGRPLDAVFESISGFTATGATLLTRVESAPDAILLWRSTMPRIAQTAKILWGIYLIITALGFGAYLLAGMGPFDAVNHVFTTVATGGFSTTTTTASIAAFDSLAIELVAIFFMAAAGVDLAFYWRALRGPTIWPQAAEVRLVSADHRPGHHRHDRRPRAQPVRRRPRREPARRRVREEIRRDVLGFFYIYMTVTVVATFAMLA